MKEKFSLKLLNLNQPKKQFRIWLMSISTAKSYILKAARKSDEMLEPYERKPSCTVLRRESGSNPADLVDYVILLDNIDRAIQNLDNPQNDFTVRKTSLMLQDALCQAEEIYISSPECKIVPFKIAE